MDALDRAKRQAEKFLQQFLHQNELRGAGRFVACQHVGTARKRDKKLEIAFAVLDQWLMKDERVAAAVEESVDALLAALPQVSEFGVTWYTFQD